MTKTERFAVFILTHGRPDRVQTFDALREAGYSGDIVIVIDNEDASAPQYRERYGDLVHVFDKRAVAQTIDEGDNFEDRRVVLYARNACWSIARERGYDYFVQLDDDDRVFYHKENAAGEYLGSSSRVRDLDAVFAALLKFYKTVPHVLAIAMAQEGDFLGGETGLAFRRPRWRKCMNSFLCCTARPFKFVGRLNEDVNTYVSLGARGGLFFTIPQVALAQTQTQAQAGGMTEIYLSCGTYVKSFYAVMYAPSAVKVTTMHTTSGGRVHHKIRWRNAVPKVLSQQFCKESYART